MHGWLISNSPRAVISSLCNAFKYQLQLTAVLLSQLYISLTSLTLSSPLPNLTSQSAFHFAHANYYCIPSHLQTKGASVIIYIMTVESGIVSIANKGKASIWTEEAKVSRL